MEETVLLHFEIDSSKTETQLIDVNKAILNNKQSFIDLKKAYKDQLITQDEFVKESLRIQTNLKAEQKLHNDLTKALNINDNSINSLTQRNAALKKERNNLDLTTDIGLKKLASLNTLIEKNDKVIARNVSLLEKQRLNIGNYSSALSLVAPGTSNLINIFSGLTESITTTGKAIHQTGLSLQTLNNIPIVAVISGAIAVYQILNSVLDDTAKKTQEATDKQKEYSDSLTVTEGILRAIDAAINEEESSRIDALNKQKEGIDVIADRVLRLANIDKDSAKNEKLTYEQRIQLLQNAQVEYNKESDLRKKVITDYIKSTTLLDEAGNPFDSLLSKEQVLSLQDDLNKINDAALKNSEAVQIEIDKINLAIEADKKRLQAFNNQALEYTRLRDQEAEARLNEDQNFVERLTFQQLTQEEYNKKIEQDNKKHNEDIEKEEAEHQKVMQELFGDPKPYIAINQAKKQSDIAYYENLANLAHQTSDLFVKGSALQKDFALASIALSEAKAIASLVEMSEANPLNSVTYGAAGAAQYIAGFAEIIANIGAAIALVNSFDGGGWTGPGNKMDVAGIVHADEYVTPKWQVNHPAAQPHIQALESMRVKGYSDGGFVANQSTASTNNALLIANSMKHLPPIYTSVVEFTKVQNRVVARENFSSR